MEATVTMGQPAPWSAAPTYIRERNNDDRPHLDSSPAQESATLVSTLPERQDFATMTDVGLMSAVARDEHAALEALYDRYVNGCYGLALKIVRDPSVAEEIVQDVFLKLWTRPESYVPQRGKFSGWLLTLVHNRSVDKLRRATAGSRGASVPLDHDNGSGLTLADTLADAAPGPYEEAWRGEKGDLVRRALNRLPASQRQAIALAYFGGLTQKEIAERLGEPLGTIKTRTRSGLQQLRRNLDYTSLLGEAGGLGEAE